MSERATAAFDDEEAGIARRVRERAAKEDQCIICLDGSPNIATLCCGQAVHFDCLAKWLSNGTTCVKCRSQLRSAPPRQQRVRRVILLYPNVQAMHDIMQRAREGQNNLLQVLLNVAFTTPQNDANVEANDEANDDANDDPIDDANDEANVEANDDANDDDSPPPNEDTTSTVVMTPAPAPVPPSPYCRNCGNLWALSCDNHMCLICCGTKGRWSCDRHGTSRPPSDTNITANEAPLTCSLCSNLAVSGCRNNMCDSCCAPHGDFSCGRHSQLHCLECAGKLSDLECANDMCGSCCVLSGLARHCFYHGV